MGLNDNYDKLIISTKQTNVPNEYKIITRMEYILSYLLSRKHNANVKIVFEKEKYLDGDINQTRSITKE